MTQWLRSAQKTMVNALAAGTVLECDICDEFGNVLLATGQMISREFLKDLRSRGIHEVYVVTADNRREDDSTEASLSKTPSSPREPAAQSRVYSPEAVLQLQRNFNDTCKHVQRFATDIRDGLKPSSEKLDAMVDNYLAEAKRDSSLVLASCMQWLIANADGESSYDRWLVDRSVRMAVLASVAANELGFTDIDCKHAAIAATLHDISLLGRPYISPGSEMYRNHPLASVDMLDGAFGITDLTRLIVGQVHEQCDGTGYPRALPGYRLHHVSRLLNLIDAYLHLIEPSYGAVGYEPADAVAYLVQQTLYGHFDRDCLRGLVAAAGAYPVGTRVLLSDRSLAVVLRSTGPTYAQPIVRLENTQGSILDLRRSDKTIIGPYCGHPRLKRIPKSALDEILWKYVA